MQKHGKVGEKPLIIRGAELWGAWIIIIKRLNQAKISIGRSESEQCDFFSGKFNHRIKPTRDKRFKHSIE